MTFDLFIESLISAIKHKDWPIRCPKCGATHRNCETEAVSAVIYPDVGVFEGRMTCRCGAVLAVTTYYVPVEDDPGVEVVEEADE